MQINILKHLFFSLNLIFASQLSAIAEDNKKWNFLIIVVDDLGQMDISPNNPETFYKTPNLEKLAAQGMRFNQNYAASTVCSSARYGLMTGKHPARINATDWFHNPDKNGNFNQRSGNYFQANSLEHMPLEDVTIAETLKENGYKTAFIGKWHLGYEEKYWPENQGFDINVGGNWTGSPRGTDGYFPPHNNPRMKDGPVGEYLTERLTTETLGILDQFKEKDDPFLVVLAYHTVHVPFGAPKETVDEYKALKAEKTPNAIFHEEEQVWPGEEIRVVRQNQNHPTYSAMVDHMDRNVGRIMDYLEGNGLADNTIVIFTSDNGGLSSSEGHPTSNLPYRGGKGWIYEGGIRVPLIIKWPNVTLTGSTSEAAVVGTDIFPTLTEIAGINTSINFDGASIVAKLKGVETSTEQPIYWHYPHYSNQGGMPAAAVRLGQYKLIQRLEDGLVHLYDLEKDPGELSEITTQMPQKTAELKNLLLAWYKEVDAQFLKPKGDNQTPWRPID